MTSMQPDTQPLPPDLVAIDNRRTSLVILASTKPVPRPKSAKGREVVVPHEADTHQLVPGINFVPSDVVKRTLLPSDLRGDPLARIEPLNLDAFGAEDVIRRSKSAAALKLWAEHDPRPGIQAAIKGQLAEVQRPKPAPEPQ